MHKTAIGTVCGLTVAIAWLPAAAVPAQEALLSGFYGSGVHNFYERDYTQAMSELSAAIDGGTKDPRAYYYRGLTQMRLGNSAAATYDMQKGAELEGADVNQYYPVGRSLERVQGSQRQTLERYRALARAQARQRQIQRDTARYEQLRRAEAQVLRNVPVGPPPAALQPSGVLPAASVAPPSAAEPTPFDKSAPAAKPAGDKPAADSPFEEPPSVEKPAAGEAPADAEPAAEEMKAEEPADASGEKDPFADEPK